MSAELERVFSQAKLTITPVRNQLSVHIVEILELLRHWWTNDIITQQEGGRPDRKRKPIMVVDSGSEVGSSEVIDTTGIATGYPIGNTDDIIAD